MGIIKHQKHTNQRQYAANLFRSAEQRINFVYLMIMIALEAAIMIYILVNQWDDTRFYFGIRASVALLCGIAVNTAFRKKTIRGSSIVTTL